MCLGVVGVRERDRKLLPEIQAMNNEDRGWPWGLDGMKIECQGHGDLETD